MREGVVFGLVITPAAAEHAHLLVGRRREGDMTAAMSMQSPVRSPFISLHSFFFSTALLSYNLHTIKLTHCNCTI